MHVQEAAEAEGKDPLLPPQLARELKVYYGMAPARARPPPAWRLSSVSTSLLNRSDFYD